MFSPSKVTDSDSRLRRWPSQRSQGRLTMYCAARRFIIALIVVA